MESQPQNPDIRNNPEICHPCIIDVIQKVQRHVDLIKDIRSEIDNIYQVKVQQCSLYERLLITKNFVLNFWILLIIIHFSITSSSYFSGFTVGRQTLFLPPSRCIYDTLWNWIMLKFVTHMHT